MGIPELIVIATFFSIFGALALVKRQIQNGQRSSFGLRSLVAYSALRRQIGMAVESGQPPLVTPGRGPLHTAAGPASIAGLHVLQSLARTSRNGQLAPQVTVGSATLLAIAQDSFRRDTDDSTQPQDYRDNVQFIADESFPFAYAAGTADTIERGNVANSIAVGHLGSELALIGEAASRKDMSQIMGSDDPLAIAIAVASTENSLWGEEIFVASAYLHKSAWNLAAVRIQDVLRWLVIVALIGAAIIQLLGQS